MANKVSFGLKNVHYAVVTETVGEDGKITSSYATPKAWNGAVSLELSQEGSSEDFYADDRAYYHLYANAGYTGSIETAGVPDDLLKEVFGMVEGSEKMIAEYSNVESKYIALLFEIAGDKEARKYCFYRVAMNRPQVAGETITDSKTVKTVTCDIAASQRPDDYLVKVFADSNATNYATWYESVPVPA